MRKRLFNNIKGLTTVEFILIICIIFVLIGVFSIYAESTIKASRENALKNELMSLRLAVELYRSLNGKNPDNLSAIINEKFLEISPGTLVGSLTTERHYLKHSRLDRKGNLLDPFFHKYSYDKETGRVFSGTKGYESW